jgi:hypothetical protein
LFDSIQVEAKFLQNQVKDSLGVMQQLTLLQEQGRACLLKTALAHFN